jgi:arylsulfatase
LSQPAKIVSAALALLATLACSPAEKGDPPNVILISLDTLRADHVGAYGYPRATTPHLDRFAETAIVFDRAYSPAPSTLLAHASLLTGLPPETHGLLGIRDSLSSRIPTLAEVLSVAGYRTAAFVNCGWLDPSFALDRGFSTYDYAHDQTQRQVGGRIEFGRNADETNQAVVEWLDEVEGEPFFLFVHYFDVHSDWTRLPYDAPPSYIEQWALPQPSGFRSGDGERFASRYLVRMNESGIRYSEAERRYVRSLYDAGVAYTDAALGALFDRLESTGQLEDSLVIVVADHGEEFQEHGQVLHDQVFEEHVRVPLLLRLPAGDERAAGFAGARVPFLVRLEDLVPTVLTYLGLDIPAPPQGRDLLPLLGAEEPEVRAAYFRTQSGSQLGIREGRFKLIRKIDPAETLLFDLESDPGEKANVASRHPETVARLLTELARHQQEHRSRRPDAIAPGTPDPSVVEALRSLGYVVE